MLKIFLRELKDPLMVGGLLFVVSLLSFQKIDFWANVAAASSFLILAAKNLGETYIKTTQQSPLVRRGFGLVVTPLTALVCLPSFLYIFVGEVWWFFWVVAFFIWFILFVVEATQLVKAYKESK